MQRQMWLPDFSCEQTQVILEKALLVIGSTRSSFVFLFPQAVVGY